MTRLSWRQRFRKGLSRTLRPMQFWLRRQLLMFVDRLAMLTPARPEPNRILLVRVDHIGDFVLWLHAAYAIAKHYRSEGKQVTLLGNAGWAAWAEELGVFDGVLPFESERYKKDLRYRFHMATQLRRQGFGAAVHAASTRVLELGDSVVRVSGATERIGPVYPGKPMLGDTWYTRLIHIGASTTGELRKNAALASALLGRPCQAGIADLRGTVKQDRLGLLAAILPSKPYFVLFPGASHPGRKWPASRFVELATKIHSRTGWMGVVCGGPGDAADAAAIVREADCPMHNLAGQTDLGQLAVVLAGSQLLVSNETSAMHIAAVMGVRSVCILGGGHFGRFVPYDLDAEDERPLPRFAVHAMPCFGCDWKCKFHPRRGQPMPCVEDVSVNAVWRELEDLLEEAKGPFPPFGMLPGSHNPTKDESQQRLLVYEAALGAG